LLLAAAVPGTAAATIAPEATIIGAPLTRPPDADFGCPTLPLATGATETLPGDTSSCTWSTPASPANPEQGLTTPPGDGTITGIRLWVGPNTGPMSFVVLESERNVLTGAVTCCTATLVTQPVLPTPNRVNPFRTDLAVHTDGPGDTSAPGTQVTDFLALAVLNPRTPIPLVDEIGSGLPPTQLPQDAIQDPAPLQGRSAPVSSTAGYQLDLQATWIPGTPTPATPIVRFATGRIFVSPGDLHVPLRCRYDTCKGTIVVSGRPSPGRRSITYARGPFRIGQNLYRSIAVPLTVDGRSAARDRERHTIAISVTYRTPSGAKRIDREITLTF
jgi:hypothetical protein